jgi:AcrR family transcriptional regulator
MRSTKAGPRTRPKSPPRSRPYRMSRRAEQVDDTRLRIIEATVRLHTTVGPANTTIAGIAEAAGVTRLTVYRHFPEAEPLHAACRAHWQALNPAPDTEAWRGIPKLEHRARTALNELYAWFSDHGKELFPIYRDEASTPPASQAGRRRQVAAIADALLAGNAGAGARGRRLRAVAGHLVSFWTWRSLTNDQGLTDEEAADVGVRLLLAEAAAG